MTKQSHQMLLLNKYSYCYIAFSSDERKNFSIIKLFIIDFYIYEIVSCIILLLFFITF